MNTHKTASGLPAQLHEELLQDLDVRAAVAAAGERHAEFVLAMHRRLDRWRERRDRGGAPSETALTAPLERALEHIRQAAVRPRPLDRKLHSEWKLFLRLPVANVP